MPFNPCLIKKANVIIAESLDCAPEAISPAQHLCYDLLADSLALTDLIINIEEAFSFKLDRPQVEAINYVGDIYKLITQYSDISAITTLS